MYGDIVWPGEEYSINDVVGPRTLDAPEARCTETQGRVVVDIRTEARACAIELMKDENAVGSILIRNVGRAPQGAKPPKTLAHDALPSVINYRPNGVPYE